MIKRDLTNIYLADFNLLTETLYVCWIKAFDTETFQLNNSLLKELIVSYGFYNYKHTATKETFTNLTDNFRFKHLTWVNQFLDQINQDTFTNYVELYKQVICEIETNLFVLKNKEAQLAYANVLLRDFDKSYIHKMNFEEFEIEKQCKEAFEVIIDCRTSIENPSNNLTNYDLSIRLINHLDFIDKLIELFLCFEIDIIALANTHNRNLYLFNSKINKYSSNQDWGSTSIGTAYIHLPENKDLRNEVFPKFNSPLSDDCLIKIMHHLANKKNLINPNSDIWLFWFNRKQLKNPEFLIWDVSPTLLSNVIQHLCGECIAATVKMAFNRAVFVKPTKNKYECSRMYKEIEQIITISMKKNV